MIQRTDSSRWDIFCTVVDNFGDIGVCWRLSRQLVAEHGIAVRLWVDDLSSFQRLCPAIEILPQQWQQGVNIKHWHSESDFRETDVADVVVEAFACALPESYLSAMVKQVKAGGKEPLWLNLEYLTAEVWAGEYHTLPSVEPKSGLRKFFFFPGFVPQTGGLLREASLFSERDCLQADPSAQALFLQSLGVQSEQDALLISLFAYENAALPSLLDAMRSGTQPIHLLVPEGRMTAPVQAYLGERLIQPVSRGALTIQSIPFVAQPDYDRLLWCCDMNLVRGEDSLIRAIWAGRPMLWHCYPQADNVHMLKLGAFLDLYVQALPEDLAALVIRLSEAWNLGLGELITSAWWDYVMHLPELTEHARNWATDLARQPDLVCQMLAFQQHQQSR